ncbi:MAG: S8 family serine peptidase, partial [Acidobacteriota bacterium]
MNRAAVDSTSSTSTAWIVEATSTELARARVEQVGGEVTHELEVISAVAARLDAGQHRRLIELDPSLRIVRDAAVTLSTTGSGASAETDRAAVPAKIGADTLHAQGIRGQGITVAVLDTGLWNHEALLENTLGAGRLLAHYDARNDQLMSEPSDENGHGTHVTGILASSDTTSDARFHGVAPNVDLVTVAAFDRAGQATYADVIRGLDWIVTHRALYDIRVLALAFSAPTHLPYWQDPLARAV